MLVFQNYSFSLRSFWRTVHVRKPSRCVLFVFLLALSLGLQNSSCSLMSKHFLLLFQKLLEELEEHDVSTIHYYFNLFYFLQTNKNNQVFSLNLYHWIYYYSLFEWTFLSFQLLPCRYDWDGERQKQSFDEVVSIWYRNLIMFNDIVSFENVFWFLFSGVSQSACLIKSFAGYL